MTDGKLDALRCDPAFAPLAADGVLRLGRLVDLVDLRPGEMLSPADAPPHWGYYCSTGQLHVLVDGQAAPPATAPVLFLPADVAGRALVAAAPSRVVVLPVRAVDGLLSLAPGLRAVRRYDAGLPVPQARA